MSRADILNLRYRMNIAQEMYEYYAGQTAEVRGWLDRTSTDQDVWLAVVGIAMSRLLPVAANTELPNDIIFDNRR